MFMKSLQKMKKYSRVLTWSIALSVFVIIAVELDYIFGCTIDCFTVSGGSSSIEVKWDSSSAIGTNNNVMLEISDDEGLIQAIELNPVNNMFVFENVKDKTAYNFTIYYKGLFDFAFERQTQRTIYIAESSIPHLPLIEIETVTGQDPTYEIIEPQGNNRGGVTIKNNDYVTASFSLRNAEGGGIVQSQPVSIKIRGNTSATNNEKKPYRLHFENKVDLFEYLGEDHREEYNDWILVAVNSIDLPVGREIAKICQSCWQPEGFLINLRLNGDWKGTYYCVQSLSEGVMTNDITENGFLIENDTYYWTEAVFFKTEHQHSMLGYTFKYPNSDTIAGNQITWIRNKIAQFEQALYGDQRIEEHIDVYSFVNWIIFHDIMGTEDSYGSNMFLYVVDCNDDDSSLLRMGPVWDYYSSLNGQNTYATIHESNVFYYDKLFSNQSFVDAYEKRWDEICEDIYPAISSYYSGLDIKAIDDSFALDAERWNTQYESIQIQMDNIAKKINQRIDVIDSKVQNGEVLAEDYHEKESNQSTIQRIMSMSYTEVLDVLIIAVFTFCFFIFANYEFVNRIVNARRKNDG